MKEDKTFHLHKSKGCRKILYKDDVKGFAKTLDIIIEADEYMFSIMFRFKGNVRGFEVGSLYSMGSLST